MGDSRLMVEEEARLWEKFCGFLDLSLEEFQAIQDQLLEEELELLAGSPLGQALFKGRPPRDVREFRERFPLTSYDDYLPYLKDRDGNRLPYEKPRCWAYTSTAGGAGKWVPYTERAYNRLVDDIMAALILASARRKGEVNVREGDRGIYNVAPPPFLSGLISSAMVEKFGFIALPPLEEADRMEFTQKIEAGFQMALKEGVDILCSLSSVLVKMGERLERRNGRGQHSPPLHPMVLFRLGRAYLRSRLEKRGILPRDLWQVKALIAWGLDTSLYREKIAYYWGREPYEFHACTEAGILALQSWNKKGLTPIPYSAYFEFITEEDWARSKQDPSYVPSTLLLGEVEPGRRYELVISNFYGMPFLRYRGGHLVRVLAREDPETGVALPQLAFVGRTDTVDLAGFTRLDEKTIWQAIVQTSLPYEEWVAVKEFPSSSPLLHLYIEGHGDESQWQQEVHQNLKALDPAYRDLEGMLGLQPLRVSLLPPGTFASYYQEKQRQGVNLMEARLPHINPSPQAMTELLSQRNLARV